MIRILKREKLMKKVSTKTNLFYNMLYQILIMILPLITTPYIARVVGADGVGMYSYNESIALYFIYFSMLGVLNYGNRKIAKCSNEDEVNKTFSSIYAFQIITSLFVSVFYIIYIFFIAKIPQLYTGIFFIYVISAFFDVSWLFFGLQEFKLTAIRQMFIRIATFVSIFVFVKTSQDLWIYMLIMCLGNLISPMILWLIMLKKIKWIRPSFKQILEHLKPNLILFIPIIATSIYRVLDKIMIGKFCNMTDVGYYEGAEKLIYISLGLIASFCSVMMPKISNLISDGKTDKSKEISEQSMKIAMCMGMAICFGIASVSNEFIPIFFGNEFKASIILSILLSFTVPIITWATITRMLYLIPYEKDKVYMKSVILGAILDFILNLIFIPILGILGAVIGTIVAELSVTLYQTISIKRDINIFNNIKHTLIFTLFGIIMTICVRTYAHNSDTSITSLILEIIFGGIIYISLCGIYLYKTQKNFFIQFIKRKDYNNEKK